MFDTDTPMILTTREREQCEAAYREWRANNPERVQVSHDLFAMVEYGEEALGPHVRDISFIDVPELRRYAYGPHDPLDILLNAMAFPPDTAILADGMGVSRAWVKTGVRKLVYEGMTTDLSDDYMPRSIVMGWITLAHRHVLQGVEMAA